MLEYNYLVSSDLQMRIRPSTYVFYRRSKWRSQCYTILCNQMAALSSYSLVHFPCSFGVKVHNALLFIYVQPRRFHSRAKPLTELIEPPPLRPYLCTPKLHMRYLDLAESPFAWVFLNYLNTLKQTKNHYCYYCYRQHAMGKTNSKQDTTNAGKGDIRLWFPNPKPKV